MMVEKNYTSNSNVAQRQRLLQALRDAGSKGVTTIEAREELDCMAPAARVHELRHIFGLNIQLINDYDINAQGNKHRCGRYVLLSGRYCAA